MHGGKVERFGFWAVRVGTDGNEAVIVNNGFFVPVGSHSFTSPAFACKSAVLAVAIASLFKVFARLALELKDWSETRTKTLGGMLVLPILIAPSMPLPVGKS